MKTGLFGCFPRRGRHGGLFAQEALIGQGFGLPKFAPGAHRAKWFRTDLHRFFSDTVCFPAASVCYSIISHAKSAMGCNLR